MRVIEGKTEKEQYRFEVKFQFFKGQAPYFSITGTTWESGKTKTERNMTCCGALTLGDYVPELAHLDKYHLCSVEMPMHYIANALYFASNRDHYGLLKGEKKFRKEYRLKFEGFPFIYRIKGAGLHEALLTGVCFEGFKVVPVSHPREPKTYSDNYSFQLGERVIDADWYQTDFKESDSAEQMLEALQTIPWTYEEIDVLHRVGEGKEPDLKAARASAVWPEAELEDFTEEKLKARLPDLMRQFKNDVEAADIAWPEGY